MARAAETQGQAPAVRHYGTMLRVALEQMLEGIGRQYHGVKDASPDYVIELIARDHMIEVKRERWSG